MVDIHSDDEESEWDKSEMECNEESESDSSGSDWEDERLGLSQRGPHVARWVRNTIQEMYKT